MRLMNQPGLGQNAGRGRRSADNESPGESGQLPVTGFADLIAGNLRLPAERFDQKAGGQAKKALSCLEIGLNKLFQFID
jgi:hypothetical protein